MSGEPAAQSELFLQAHLTARCNLTCRHCYGSECGEEMQPAVFRRALDQFAALQQHLGHVEAWVQLTGGEPLLHPQVWELLAAARARFRVRLLTNGTVVTAAVAQRLRAHRVSVQVSLDGPEPVHDARRGTGAYRAALEGLRNLHRAGVVCSVRATVGDDNQEQIETLFAGVRSYVRALNVSRVVPIGECEVGAPETAAYRRLIYRLYARGQSDPAYHRRDPFFGVLLKADGRARGFGGCSAGLSGLCVTEDGTILPCRRLPVALGQVMEDELVEVYQSHPLLIDLRARRFSGRCGQCEDREVCGGSRCVGYAAFGDPLASDPGCIFA